MEKDMILAEIEKIGKRVAEAAEPSYWPLEKVKMAEDYKVRLKALRQLYARVRADKDTKEITQDIRKTLVVINNGIEGNMLRRLLERI